MENNNEAQDLNQNTSTKISITLVLICLILICFGTTFKIMGWMGSAALILVPSGVIWAHGVIKLVYENKNILSLLLTLIGSVFFIFILISSLFNRGLYFNALGGALYLITFLISVLIMRFKLKKKA